MLYYNIKKNEGLPEMINYKKLLIILSLMIAISTQISADTTHLTLTTKKGTILSLVPESLDSFTEIPLKTVRNNLNKKYKNLEFFNLYTLKVKPGQEVIANLRIKDSPKRITGAVLFQQTEAEPQFLKVVGSGYFQLGTNIQIEGVIPNFFKIVVLFIADATRNPDHLSENLKTIFNDETASVQITDFGTNWSMSDVEVTFEAESPKGKSKKEATINFEEEINKLYAPQWVMSIRLIIDR